MTTLDTRDGFSIELNGVKYEIDLSRYRRATIDATRAQNDPSSESSEQTLNNQYLWKRSGEDFGLGHGQKYFDADQTSSRKRFESSLNVNVWNDRQVTLLNKTTNRLAGETNASSPYVGQPLSKGMSWMFPLEGRLIYIYNTRSGATVSGSNITGNNNGFRITYVNSSTASPWVLTTIFEDGETYSSAGSFGVSSVGSGGGSPSVLFDSPNLSSITDAVSDGSSIYFTVYGKGGVTQLSIDPTDGELIVASNVGISTNYYFNLHCVGGKVYGLRNNAGLTTTFLKHLKIGSEGDLDEWPIDQAPQLTSAVIGPDGIYWANAGTVLTDRYDWASQKTTISVSKYSDTTAEYGPLSPITSFPEGEIVNTMLEYSGYILFGTTKGFRLGQFTQTGGVTYGPLNEVGNVYKESTRVFEAAGQYFNGGVTHFEPEERYVWFNWNRYDDFTATETGAARYFGLGRIDLGQLVDELQPAYAPDIMVADTYYNNAYSTSVTVDCLCLFNKKLYFGTNYAGVFGEGSIYAANGYFKTGKINYGTAEQKRFARLELKGTVSSAGSDSIYSSLTAQDPGSTVNTFTYGAGGTSASLNLTDSYGEYAEVFFKLTSTTTTGAVTPILNRWTLRSIPLPERQEEIFLPIIIKDNVTHNFVTSVSLDGYTEFADLRALMQSREIVPLVMGDETMSVIVDSIITGMDQGVKLDRWNSDESWPDGIWYVRCITIQDTAVSAVPVHAIAAATVDAGTVTTLSVSSPATVVNAGTSSAAVFDFGIPVGATGATGIQTSATAPIDTSILWADTTTTGAGGTVPSGGTIGQVLAKNSGTNYDTEWASVGSAARPLLTSGAYLDGTGLVLNGLTGNYASTPDTAALSISGDIDIKAKVTLADWTPSGARAFVAKRNTTSTISYLLYLTAGTLRLATSPDGTATNAVEGVSVATGIADGSTKWVRATLQVDDGSSQRVYKFYTSNDGVSWTQLGTTITTAGTTSIYDTASPVEIGTITLGTSANLIGTVHRAIIQSAFDTTDNTTSTVFDADFSTQTADALAFTESSVNAATVTINTTRYSYGIPNTQSGSISTGSLTSGNDRYQRFVVTRPIVVDMALIEVTTGPASAATVYFGLYAANDNWQPTGNVLLATDLAVGTSATGVFTKQVTPVTLQAGTYLFATNSSVTMTVRTLVNGDAAIGPSYGSSGALLVFSRGRTAGTFGNNPNEWNTTASGSTAGQINYALLRYKAAS